MRPDRINLLEAKLTVARDEIARLRRGMEAIIDRISQGEASLNDMKWTLKDLLAGKKVEA